MTPSAGTFATLAESALKPQLGLKPADVQAIPCLDLESAAALIEAEMHCPICLSDFAASDNIRQLPGCGHCFHQSCVDLWLIRRPDCPMCKGSVQISGKRAMQNHAH